MKLIDGALAVLGRVNDVVAAIGKWVGLTLVGLMTLVIVLQVFFRYVLNDALAWSEEVARFMMVWMAFLVAPIAYRQGANVAIDMVPDLLPGRARAVLKLVLNLLVLALLVTLFRESLGVVQRGLRITASSLPLPMAWIYVSMPVGVAAMFLVGIEQVLEAVRGMIDPHRRVRHDPDVPVMQE